MTADKKLQHQKETHSFYYMKCSRLLLNMEAASEELRSFQYPTFRPPPPPPPPHKKKEQKKTPPPLILSLSEILYLLLKCILIEYIPF